MPITLSQIACATTSIPVQLGDEELNVTFRTNFYTPALSSRIASCENPTAVVVETMSQAIVNWDLTDDTGAVVPISLDSLQALPIGMLQEIFSAMTRALCPNSAKASS